MNRVRAGCDGWTNTHILSRLSHAHLSHVPNCTSSLPSQSGEISIEEFIHGMRGRGLALDDEQFKGLHDDCDNNHDCASTPVISRLTNVPLAKSVCFKK